MTGSGSTGALEYWSTGAQSRPRPVGAMMHAPGLSPIFPPYWLRSVSMHRGREAPRQAVAVGVRVGGEAGTLFPRTVM